MLHSISALETAVKFILNQQKLSHTNISVKILFAEISWKMNLEKTLLRWNRENFVKIRLN